MLNSKKIVGYLISVIVLLTLIGAGCGQNTPQKMPSPGSNPAPAGNQAPKIILGYYENKYPGAPEYTGSLPNLEQYHASLTGIAPYWYTSQQDGSIATKEDPRALDFAKTKNLKIYALVTNRGGEYKSILGDSNVRHITVTNIAKLVDEKNVDGINIDFELLPPEQRDNFSAFIAELYPLLNAKQRTLVVSIFPQVGVSNDVSGAYDYPALSKSSDFLQIMTYDHHFPGSDPGPVADINWVEENVKSSIQKAGSADKILLGIAAYGYNWPASGQGVTITHYEATKLAKEKGVEIMFDDQSKSPHFKYNGHTVWFENARSIAYKVDLVKKYNLRGVALWRLGQEDPNMWDEINKRLRE